MFGKLFSGKSMASVADHLQSRRIPILEAQVKWSICRIQVVVVLFFFFFCFTAENESDDFPRSFPEILFKCFCGEDTKERYQMKIWP